MSMRLPRLVLAVLAVAVIGSGSFRSVAAQDGSDEALDFEEFEGIEQVVSRTYSIDFAALMASPDAAADPASLELTGIVTLIAFVAAFDGDDNAESGWDRINAEFEGQAAEITGDESAEFVISEVDDLGDEATSYTTMVVEEEETYSTAVIIVRDGEYVYIAIGITAGEEDGVAPTTTVAQALEDNDAGDGEAEQGEDGFYSGGVWDKLPEGGDEALAGLSPRADEVVYPTDDATPEA